MRDSNHGDFDTAFVTQLTEHQLGLQLYVRSLLPGDPAAGDVAQQTNTKLWEKRSQFEMGTNFKAWAFSIARYEVLNYRKSQARDSRLVFSGELEEIIESELAEPNPNLRLRHEALRECLGKLMLQWTSGLRVRRSIGGSHWVDASGCWVLVKNHLQRMSGGRAGGD